jgi:cytochrome b
MKSLTFVWDPFVRIFHWSLVTSFAAAWLTGDDYEKIHIKIGYAILCLICFRLVWGFVGSKYARFSQFVKPPKEVIGYVKDIATGTEKRFIGHNPAGGAMILVLLVGILGLCITGWMYTTDMFWGVDWVEEVHEFLATALLGCVFFHLVGVLIASVRHKENLVKSMFTGTKDSH